MIGGAMNPVMDALAGGWSLSAFITIQSGQPLALFNNSALLADGNQRPNVVCSQLKSGLSYHEAAMTPRGSILNQNSLAIPEIMFLAMRLATSPICEPMVSATWTLR